ncbi:MAG: hypothetical protein OXR64_11715 [Chloroflexota bacterium]|nr:hypothetical protein [Chloroflexota bacterium]
MTRRLPAVAGAALMVLLAVAALWPSAPPPARAQTAPDVRLRETAATSPEPPAGARPAQTLVTLRLSSATLDENSRALPDGADLTLLAQPTYVALPGAGPNLLRISPAITITARDAGGRDPGLSPAARLTFSQPKAEAAAVYRLDGVGWRPVQAATLGRALVVQPVSPGTYALFAELPPDWPLRNDLLTAVALNATRLVADDLATQPRALAKLDD